MRKSWRVAMAGIAALNLTFLLPVGTKAAPASYCSSSGYCIYEPQGWSGSGARGTGSLITLPTVVSLQHTDEQVVGTVFLYTNASTAIETGIGWGADVICGWNPFWTPYGTLNNGSPEQNNCGLHLDNGSTWQIQAFVTNGTGFSFFNSQYGTPQWAINWGPYDIAGLNLDFSEIHGDNAWPYYDQMFFVNEQWWNGSSWSYWGYTNVANDCPYYAHWVSNSYWWSYDAGHC